MAIVQWNKKYTETLAETLKRFRLEKPEYSSEKVTYAGRLDPMAEGLVILLTGSDVHKKSEFLGFDKTYEIDFILGPTTDTYDVLGICSDESENFIVKNQDEIVFSLEKYTGVHSQKYPPYSSKPVQGKPLFMWAREDRLDEIIIPVKEIEIYNIEYKGSRSISMFNLQSHIIENINAVQGDFRQQIITESWQNYFNKNKNKENQKICIYTVKVSASSGAYMRTLVCEIGKLLDIPSCSLKIKRTDLGKYHL